MVLPFTILKLVNDSSNLNQKTSKLEAYFSKAYYYKEVFRYETKYRTSMNRL